MCHAFRSRRVGLLLRLHSLHSRRGCKMLALLQVHPPRSPAPELSLSPTHSRSLALSLDLARALSESVAVSLSRARSISVSLSVGLCLCLCLSRTRGVFLALSRALSLHLSSTLTLSLTLSLTQPRHHYSSQPTCRGEGSCAPDVSNGGTGAGGGHCLCKRYYFAKDCSIKLKPKWSLEYVVSDIAVSHMVR